MTRLGYLWIFLSVGVAIFTIAHESGTRDMEIRDATRSALYAGTKAGCERDNNIRFEAIRTAIKLHPDAENIVQRGLAFQDCKRLAQDFVDKYLQETR